MKPRTFDYVRAESLAEVFQAFDVHGDDAMVLAGGQNIVPALNMRLAEPAILIDINRISGLDRIEAADGVLRIGALCRHEAVRTSQDARAAPLLAAAVAHVAHPAIRNRGTLGGSLCNADPAAELPACMLALGATMHIEGPTGKRDISAEEFFAGFFETCLEPGEVLTGVSVPVIEGDEIHFFDEIARRRGDYALAGLAAASTVRDGKLSGAKLAFLSCGEKPVLAATLAARIEEVSTAAITDAEIADALGADLDPPDDPVTSSATRLHLAGVLVRRALDVFNAGGAA